MILEQITKDEFDFFVEFIGGLNKEQLDEFGKRQAEMQPDLYGMVYSYGFGSLDAKIFLSIYKIYMMIMVCYYRFYGDIPLITRQFNEGTIANWIDMIKYDVKNHNLNSIQRAAKRKLRQDVLFDLVNLMIEYDKEFEQLTEEQYISLHAGFYMMMHSLNQTIIAMREGTSEI